MLEVKKRAEWKSSFVPTPAEYLLFSHEIKYAFKTKHKLKRWLIPGKSVFSHSLHAKVAREITAYCVLLCWKCLFSFDFQWKSCNRAGGHLDCRLPSQRSAIDWWFLSVVCVWCCSIFIYLWFLTYLWRDEFLAFYFVHFGQKRLNSSLTSLVWS